MLKNNIMSNSIAVLTRLPNVFNEIQKALPDLRFRDVIAEKDTNLLSTSEIIVADYTLLIPHIKNLNNAKWIQGTWAGVEWFMPYYTEENFSNKIVTRFSGKHFGRLMSEYVVTHIVNYERSVFKTFENSKQSTWSRAEKIFRYRAISDLKIGILGIGTIGNYIARILNNFGAKIWGFGKRKSLPDTEDYKVYEKYCVQDTLPELLSNCDYIINVLPSTDDTKGLLKGEMLKNCSSKETVFINIGRGDIIKETDLIFALDNKWISYAIIDVFQEEPLTKENPLWKYDQVLITPHVSGVSRAKDIAEHFKENYELYKKGLSIPSKLSFDKNY